VGDGIEGVQVKPAVELGGAEEFKDGADLNNPNLYTSSYHSD
jgi:hypothetical protein